MISFIIAFVNAFLKAVMFSVLIGVGIFVFGVLPIHLLFKLVNGDIRTKRHYYKRFLEVLEERNLRKYTLPKMSYEQIVNFYELPEANVEGCLMDSAMACLAEDDEDGVLVLYTRKEDYLNPVTMWINNRREREKEGIILFVPKSYRDYKKLYNYFYNKGINPAAQVTICPVFYGPENAEEYPLDGYDYIVDAIDTVTSKLLLIERAHQAGTPIISALGAGNKMDATRFRPADIYETSVCPLAKVLRVQLRSWQARMNHFHEYGNRVHPQEVVSGWYE